MSSDIVRILLNNVAHFFEAISQFRRDLIPVFQNLA
jgi:hypothetical protein